MVLRQIFEKKGLNYDKFESFIALIILLFMLGFIPIAIGLIFFENGDLLFAMGSFLFSVISIILLIRLFLKNWSHPIFNLNGLIT